MEKIFLLGELISVNDIVHNIMSTMFLFLTEFEYGRCYQLLIDRSKKFKHSISYPRREQVIDYVSNKSRSEIIIESYGIINDFRKKNYWRNKKYNQWHDVWINSKEEDYFYYGRCIQFLLDANNKNNIDDLLSDTYNDVITKAHKLKHTILLSTLPKEGEVLYTKQCEERSWIVGETRCNCGRKLYLTYDDIVDNLDTTDLNPYAVAY